MKLGLSLSKGWGCGSWGGFLEDGGAAVLGVSKSEILASKSLSFLPCEMGMIMAAPCIKAHRGPLSTPSFPPSLTPSTGTTTIEEPTVTAWGLEGPSLGAGQPSPTLEDWEGESAWV